MVLLQEWLLKLAGSVDVVYTNDIQFDREEIATFPVIWYCR